MPMIRLDKVQSVYNGNLETVIADLPLFPGNVFHVGGLVPGEREAVEPVIPNAASIQRDAIVIHTTPELQHDETIPIENFIVLPGVPARAHHLTVGDIVTITTDAVAGVPVVGEFLIPADGSLLLAAAADPGNARFAAQVIELTTLGFNGLPAVAFKVIRN